MMLSKTILQTDGCLTVKTLYLAFMFQRSCFMLTRLTDVIEFERSVGITDLPAYSDTPLTVTLLACPK